MIEKNSSCLEGSTGEPAGDTKAETRHVMVSRWALECEKTGERIFLEGNASTWIGRGELSDLPLPKEDDKVSAVHLGLTPSEHGLLVWDRSLNGTRVVGGEVLIERAPVWLRRDAEIRIGDTVLKVSLGSRDEQPLSRTFASLTSSEVEMQRIYAQGARLVERTEPLHIIGEPGTGKRYFAHALHRQSTRADKPFMVVDCKTTPHDELEEQLFGHEVGAFPGAEKKESVFVAANGGTVYIHEVERLSLEAQAKLLSVLERGEVRGRNQSRPKAVNVRIMTSNSVDLAGRVNDGMFHADLYGRLCKVRLNFPPLRERRRDIESLSRQILVNLGHARAFDALTRDTINWMRRQEWREGNIAQLREVLSSAASRWKVAGSVGRLDAETAFVVHREADSARSEASRREIAIRVLTQDGQDWTWRSVQKIAATLLYEALERKAGGVILQMAKIAKTARSHVYAHRPGDRAGGDGEGSAGLRSTRRRRTATMDVTDGGHGQEGQSQ